MSEVIPRPEPSPAPQVGTLGFLDAVLPKSGGRVVGLRYASGAVKHLRFETNAEAAAAIDGAPDDAQVYYAPNSFGPHYEENGKTRLATRDNVAACRSLFADFDVSAEKDDCYADMTLAWADAARLGEVLGGLSPWIVNSGGGYHAYIVMDRDIDRAEWEALAVLKSRITRHFEMKTDRGVDTAPAHLLRPAGSMNRKYKPPVAVKVVRRGAEHSPEEVRATLTRRAAEVKAPEIAERGVRGNVPAHLREAVKTTGLTLHDESAEFDLGLMADGCPQMRRWIDEAGTNNRRAWRAGMGVALFCVDGEAKVRKVYMRHPIYGAGHSESNEKDMREWRAEGIGPTTCEEMDLATDCKKTCPHYANGKVPRFTSPIALGRIAPRPGDVVRARPRVQEPMPDAGERAEARAEAQTLASALAQGPAFPEPTPSGILPGPHSSPPVTRPVEPAPAPDPVQGAVRPQAAQSGPTPPAPVPPAGSSILIPGYDGSAVAFPTEPSTPGVAVDPQNRCFLEDDTSERSFAKGARFAGYAFRYDKFRDVVEVFSPATLDWHDRSKAVESRIHHHLNDVCVKEAPAAAARQGAPHVKAKFSLRVVNEILDGLPAEPQVAHDPVRDYCETFDGGTDEDIETLETLFTHWGAPDDSYTRYIAKALFVGLIDRALNPGEVIKVTPILVAPGDVGKSALVRRILPVELRKRYYREGLDLSKSSDDLTGSVRGKWLIELAEMKGSSKATSDKLKAWTGEGVHNARLRYDRDDRDFLNRTMLVGTANPEAKFIPEEVTAERRFPVIRLRYACVRDIDELMDEIRPALMRAAMRLWKEKAVRIDSVPSEHLPRLRDEAAPFRAEKGNMKVITEFLVDRYEELRTAPAGENPTENGWIDIGNKGATMSQIHDFLVVNRKTHLVSGMGAEQLDTMLRNSRHWIHADGSTPSRVRWIHKHCAALFWDDVKNGRAHHADVHDIEEARAKRTTPAAPPISDEEAEML